MVARCVGHLGKRTESDFFKLYSQGATREAGSSSRKKNKRKKDEEKEPEGEEEEEEKVEGEKYQVTRSLPSNETRTTN